MVMGDSQENNYADQYAVSNSKPFPSPQITAVEQTLTQSMVNFKELVSEFEQLHLENDNYRKLLLSHKEKQESQTCCHCEELKKTVARKEQILNSIVSVLKKLMQTKDFSLIDAILIQIQDQTDVLTPLTSISPQKLNTPPKGQQNLSQFNDIESNNIISKKKVENAICKDDSVSEIEDTPTGRKSPIFPMRKSKNSTNSIILKDKKKCPESWPTPEKKSLKLTYPSPTTTKSRSRLRQGRLNLAKLKSSDVVDLTCSPENNEARICREPILQTNLVDNDETILPSPTSGHVRFSPLHKIMIKTNATIFKKPIILESNIKVENDNIDWNSENKLPVVDDVKEIEDSINLLNQFPNRFKSPTKREIMDETHCGNESISLLDNLKRVEVKSNNQPNSPDKHPLIENINITNLEDHDNNSSISILKKDVICRTTANDIAKRVKAELEPAYREPAPRTKAEKRALPGWSCDRCKNFFDELYKDNLEMLALKMNECSKHRGRNNPIRPKTPENFWNPRWDVPKNTEEFNKRNNV